MPGPDDFTGEFYETFLETHNLPKLNQEESENLSRQLSPREIEAAIRKLPINKSPGIDGFKGNFIKHSRKN